MSVTKNAEGGTGSCLASHPQTNDAQCDRLVSSVREPRKPLCASDHCTDAAVLGLGAARGLGGCWWRAMVVGAVNGVGGVCCVAPVAVLCVRRVGRLLAVRRGRVVLVWRVLQVSWRVVVVVVVVRRRVLGHVAELGVVWVHGDRCFCLHPGCVVQVGGVRGVADEGGVQGLRGGAGGLHPPGAKQRSKQ